MIYAVFESILVPEANEKQNPNGSQTNKYKNMMLAVIAINWHMMTISLVNLLNHTCLQLY